MRGDVVYSYVASNSQMDNTIQEMEELLPDLLRLAEIEKLVSSWPMRSKRHAVGSMDWNMRPSPISKETIYYIEMKLEEAERANLVRMMKVK